jgi:hypothetical protein
MNSTKEKIRQVLLERIFSFVLLSKRSFDGCCAAKSSRETSQLPINTRLKFPQSQETFVELGLIQS